MCHKMPYIFYPFLSQKKVYVGVASFFGSGQHSGVQFTSHDSVTNNDACTTSSGNDP